MLELNLSAGAVKELKKAIDMGIGVNLSLGIGGQVTVSGGGGVPAAIQDAIDGSTGAAFFIDTSDASGWTDGQLLNSFSTAQGVDFTSRVTDAVAYDATAKLIEFTASGITSDQMSLGDGMDFYCVMNTSDAAFMLGSCVVNTTFFGCAQTSTSAPDSFSGNPTYRVNGVIVSPDNRTALRNAISTGAKVVVSVRGLNLSAASYSSEAGVIFFDYVNTGFQYTGLAGDVLLCDAQDNTSAAAIEAALAERHGITLA